MSQHWKQDLEFGEQGEKRFCERYRGWQRAETRNSSYDLKSGVVTVELKTERYVVDVGFENLDKPSTNNLCIEFQNTNLDKPSGLFVSQATFWIHQFECGSTFVYRTEDLKKYIETNASVFRVHQESNASNYLVPISSVRHLELEEVRIGDNVRWVSRELKSKILRGDF